MPPGLRYTRDEQCQAIIGESGSFYYGILSNICTVLQCYRPSTDNIIDFEGRALDLTACGNHMVFREFLDLYNSYEDFFPASERVNHLVNPSLLVY